MRLIVEVESLVLELLSSGRLEREKSSSTFTSKVNDTSSYSLGLSTALIYSVILCLALNSSMAAVRYRFPATDAELLVQTGALPLQLSGKQDYFCCTRGRTNSWEWWHILRLQTLLDVAGMNGWDT